MSEPAKLWNLVRSETLGEAIVQRVRDALFDGQLKPGDRLGTEASLAASFGVSRVTIRDALRALETLGIIEIRAGANGGAFVAQGNTDRLSDALAIQFKLIGLSNAEIIDSQLAIESAAIDVAMINGTADDIAALHAILGEANSAIHSPADFNRIIMDFHRRLVAAAHNRFLNAEFRALAFVLEPVMTHRTRPEFAPRIVEAYERLVNFMADGDGASARALLTERLKAARHREIAEDFGGPPAAGASSD